MSSWAVYEHDGRVYADVTPRYISPDEALEIAKQLDVAARKAIASRKERDLEASSPGGN